MRRRLSSSPGVASQSGQALADGQIHPLDTSRVQPLREAEVLQQGRESGLCPQAHQMNTGPLRLPVTLVYL